MISQGHASALPSARFLVARGSGLTGRPTAPAGGSSWHCEADATEAGGLHCHQAMQPHSTTATSSSACSGRKPKHAAAQVWGTKQVGLVGAPCCLGPVYSRHTQPPNASRGGLNVGSVCMLFTCPPPHPLEAACVPHKSQPSPFGRGATAAPQPRVNQRSKGWSAWKVGRLPPQPKMVTGPVVHACCPRLTEVCCGGRVPKSSV